MKIILGKTAGFCGGVEEAVRNTEKALEEFQNICCLGELVHNKEVVQSLESKGLKIVEHIKEAGDRLIIRAHGVEKRIYEEAKENKIELLDYTCKKVTKIHELVEEYSKKEYFIVLIGERKHPEVIGTYSFCGENKNRISQIEELDLLVESITKSPCSKILVVAQTTFNGEKFDRIVEELQKKLEEYHRFEIEIKKTICNATKLRQNETMELATKVDLMIIIGGKNSSNTNKLFEIASKYGKDAILVETKEELNWDKINKSKKLGIMAGASTPKESIDEVICAIEEKY